MTRRTGFFAALALASVVISVVVLTTAVANVSVRPAAPATLYAPTATALPARPAVVKPIADSVTAGPDVPPPVMEPALPARFMVPAAGIDAPVVEAGLDANGNMADPDGPEEAAWYSFTAKPGSGGNAVFSGHLDWYATGPAVFWRLREVVPGDQITIALADGSTLEYSVAWSRTYLLADTPMNLVLENSNIEAVTIITCAGEFIDGDYTERMVVRAFRVPD